MNSWPYDDEPDEIVKEIYPRCNGAMTRSLGAVGHFAAQDIADCPLEGARVSGDAPIFAKAKQALDLDQWRFGQ